MTTEAITIALILFFTIALLYSSVGHAGASGYLAIMALMSFDDDAIKPTSLILNIVVASIASWQFIRAGLFDLRIFLAFAVTSIPMAFVGGGLDLDPTHFKLAAGIFLILSSVLLLLKTYLASKSGALITMPLWAGLVIGPAIGFFSGLIGVGGGIFLSPLLVLAGWANAKVAGGIAALFILLNSIAGLFGKTDSLKMVDETIWYWVLAVILGGLLGSWLGSKKLNTKIVISFLFVVLLSAGLKFLFYP